MKRLLTRLIKTVILGCVFPTCHLFLNLKIYYISILFLDFIKESNSSGDMVMKALTLTYGKNLSNIFSRHEWPMTLAYGVKHPVVTAAVRSKAVVLL